MNTLIFVVIAYFPRKQNDFIVPLLLKFSSDPITEDYLRRTLSLGYGSPMIF